MREAHLHLRQPERALRRETIEFDFEFMLVRSRRVRSEPALVDLPNSGMGRGRVHGLVYRLSLAFHVHDR